MRKSVFWLCCGFILIGAMFFVSAFNSPAFATNSTEQGSAIADNASIHAACPPTIRQGSTGPWVKNLQQRLNDWGWRDQDGKPLVVDGVFGSRTTFVVKNFQSIYAPPADGIVGPNTWKALNYC